MAQKQSLTRIAHEHFVGVVLVVVGVRQSAIKPAGRLAETRTVRFDKLHVRGGNHRRTIAATLRIKKAEGKTSRRKRFHGLAEDRPVLGRVTEAVRSYPEIVAPSEAAAQHSGPSFKPARIAYECKILLTVRAIRDSSAEVVVHGRLNRSIFHSAADVGIPAIRCLAGSVGHLHILHHQVLRHGGRLPQTGGRVSDRNAVVGNAQRSRRCEARCLARPSLLDSIENDRIFRCAGLSIADHVCARGGLKYLRAAGQRTSRVQLFAVEHAHRFRHQHHVLTGGHGLGFGVNGSTHNDAVVQCRHLQRRGNGVLCRGRNPLRKGLESRLFDGDDLRVNGHIPEDKLAFRIRRGVSHRARCQIR